MTVRFSVTVRQVLEDGSEAPVEGEVAAALAGPAEQFAGLAAWAADEARFCDHGEREKVIGEEGRELQRLLLQAAFDIDSAREQRAAQVTSAAGIRHGTVEAGHGRGVTSVFGPVRVTRLAYRNRREPNLYPADARQVLPDDPYSLGMRSLAAFHLAAGGFGQAQEVIGARTGVTVGRAQLTGLAEDLAAWTGDFYEQRARDADTDLPATDVIMMQGDGKGIAMRPEHRKNGGKSDSAHPGIKKMAEIVAVADFTPAVREPGDIAAPPARRQAHPGPKARDKWVSASVTESIEDMIAAAYDEADRRDPQRARQRVFLVDGNRQQITAIEAQAEERGLKVPVLIDLHPRQRLIHGTRRALINVFNDLDVRSLSPLLKSYLRGFRNDEERVLVAYCLAVRPASGERTWTVVDASYATVGPVEEWLEAHRYLWSPNTVRGYATSLAQWWSFLEQRDESGQWAEAGVPAVTGFLSWLRNGRTVERSLAVPDGAPSADTLNARLAALLSFYQWQAAVHDVPVASRLMRGRPSRVPSRGLLAHLDGRRGLAPTSLVKVRRRRRDRPPLLLPQEIQAIIDGCASWDTAAGDWKGNLRDRLIFSVLAETGMRLGEVLGMTIGDFVMGLGGTAYIEVTPREGNANGARVKMMRPRRVHVGADLERLFADYLTHLACRAASLGLEITPDSPLLVNLDRPPLLAAMREGTVRDKVTALKKKGIGPPGWTPHWFRHSHASALLLAGTPEWVVSRRLGHAHVQTTIDLYGWVREDEALKAAANWKTYTSGWRAGHDG